MSPEVDVFLAQYYARHPVNATFTGVHTHDPQLPDWSPDARADDSREMHDLRTSLAAAPRSLDIELAIANLDVRKAEHESGFMHDRNPALWTGEAIFGAVSLMLRPFAPRNQRLGRLIQRLDAIPSFLETMRVSITAAVPPNWSQRAQRECRAALRLFGPGLDAWLALEPAAPDVVHRVHVAAQRAQAAFHASDQWLATLTPASVTDCSAGPALFDVLLRRGHFCDRPADELLREALEALVMAKASLASLAGAVSGSWSNAEAALAADHPAADDYIGAFDRTWAACRELSLEHDLVTWPDWPIRYVPFPEWARDAAPELYWLYYRSPAPFDAYTIHDYLVMPGWNNSAIKLNHVVHHGALGHHVQNWHASQRSRTKIGTIAAVDCASRIGMFQGGSLAEGWACYATELMEEHGFLSPLERVAQQQSRVRMLARAIVDIRLHTQGLTPRAAVQYYVEEVGISQSAAEGEVTKNTLFPCTALMYWLGTQGILDLRTTVQRQRGAAFRLKAFHDELLSYGSIPVPLIARLMT